MNSEQHDTSSHERRHSAEDGKKNEKPPQEENVLRDGKEGSDQGAVTETESKSSKANRQRTFPIVAIGFSAGGLEALQEFFSHMPPDPGVAFIVVTHMHKGHVSMLPDIISRSAELSVVGTDSEDKLRPNTIYVAAPGELIEIRDEVLYRVQEGERAASSLPIDHLFRWLAADRQELGICVILSGTGSDGTLGLRAIKAEGGMVMVQDPTTAKFAGMPSSAIATGMADYVTAPHVMPSKLLQYVKGPYIKKKFRSGVESPFPEEQIQRIISLVRKRTGHDFSSYKQSTMRRRMERRMNLNQIADAAEYVRYSQENPQEIDRLFQEMLIGVTSFFRDPEAFEALAQKALPDLFQSRPEGHTIRAWVPGCSTGEEAYSVAIVLDECIHEMKKDLRFQVFGTDLDANAVVTARNGSYSDGIAADVSAERLEKYFVKEDSTYRIRKDIREKLVFAPQDVIQDPPFTKLDLIVCRNLLIYLNGDLQKRLLPMFHYALRQNSLLFLGSSENVTGLHKWFDTIDSKWKIFRRRENAESTHEALMIPIGFRDYHDGTEGSARSESKKQAKAPNVLQEVLLSRFAPPCVVVDRQGGIAYIHGRTGLYLEPAQGEPSNNLFSMVREGLSRPLMIGLREAAKDDSEYLWEAVRVKANGYHVHVNLSIKRIDQPDTLKGLFIVSFHPCPPEDREKNKTKKVELNEAQLSEIEELQRELKYSKEELQARIEDAETSSEELQSANEELQSTNEELQSSNEELETSKEELQSLNEELSTVNSELQTKVEQLSRANDDMQNLLNSIQVATIFLDNDLKVKRYTDQAQGLIRLIQSDIGRPLGDLASNLDYDGLIDDCREVLQTLQPREMEVKTRDGHWELMRILPYRKEKNIIDGVVITLVDIDRLKTAESQAEKGANFERVVQTVRTPLVVLDSSLRLFCANEYFLSTFNLQTREIQKKSIYEWVDGGWDIEPLRRFLERTLREDDVLEDFRIEQEFPRIGKRTFLVNACRLEQNGEIPEVVVLTFEEAKE